MTFLRWAGSKKQLLDVLLHLWCASGSNGRYIESFSGSAALFFYIRPQQATLIDCNDELQHCLNAVKNHPLAVSSLLQKYVGNEAEYYLVRSIEPQTLTKIERAARFIYLNRFCFNGLYRTNSKGKFNVPYGGNRCGTIPDKEELIIASESLKNTEIVCGDFFEETITRIKKNDFIYLDPPYAKVNSSLDHQYGPSVFGTKDLERLSDLLHTIDKIGAFFTVSYADCSEIRAIASHWTLHSVRVRRVIAASAEKRGTAEELLITNF